MPPPFPPHLRAAAQTLHRIFHEGGYADREVARTLKSDKRYGSKDRARIAELVYETVRYYRLYAHLAGREPLNENDWWLLLGVHLILQGEKLPDWREFTGLDPQGILQAHSTAEKIRPLRESIPNWLDQLGQQQLAADWPATLTALNETAPVVLRANRLNTTPKELTAALETEGITVEPIAEDALRVTERKNLFRTKAFRAGLFELQDYSSQQAAPALEVEPGMTVVDACAGAGGKSLHLAALMENKGRLLSLDIHGWKLKELKKRARRAGVTNLEPRPITSTKVVKRLHGKADRVLLDVPCSGLGVLRRNPDAKWKLTPESIDRVLAEQTKILTDYSKMVRTGGKLVYATCSILPRENSDQVRQFLESEAGRGWTLEHEQSFLPQRDGYDGFFVSRLARTS
jgi:16S rRNA (cytosine967-C5)-methyltransferase